MVNKEEKLLQERLKNLENKYKENLFSEDGENIAEPKIDIESEDLEGESVEQETESIEEPEVEAELEPELIEEPESSKSELPVKISTLKTGIKRLKQPFKKGLTQSISGKKVLTPPAGVKKISEAEIKRCVNNISRLKKEMSKVILGQEDIVNGLIMGLLCNAHVLVEGVPGIAKTLAIRALASASGCIVKRIQFTVDMLPTDIIGLTNYTPEKGFEIIKGPIFTNFLIADEINRAPPKTQSALIEGMQEKQVTIGRKKFHLPNPFFVMATENPIENAGVYPLPEAQIDRFLFKLIMGYPKESVEKKVMETNITIKKFESFGLKPVINPKEILRMQGAVQKIYLDDNIKDYILAIVRKTRNKEFKNSEYITYGSSPRASIGLFITSKARALMHGRSYVLPEDVKKVVFDVMRHRLILSYKATLDKISPDSIIQEILNSVSVK